jgi:NAD+ diphosphatase
MPLPRNPNAFANNPLDRASALRADPEKIAALRARRDGFVIPLWKLRPLSVKGPDGRAEAGFLAPGLAEGLMGEGVEPVFLGLDAKGRPYFALDITAAADPETAGPIAGLGVFKDMRALAAEIDAGDTAILGQAKALVDWHARHRFCAACGAPTAPREGGYKRVCAACGAEHFPRTDPVVIMLATAGDTCLLGRGRNFPKGMFSALAGFIEPGESIEEAVAREIEEEAGIKIGSVTYHSTQPWPFPSSLMIGCIAEAETTEITVDESELAEARWVGRETILATLAGNGPSGFWVPPPLAIAHQLIKAWAEG